MSVVVAIKQNGRIYIGADSQVTSGGTRTTLHNQNNYKVWKVIGSDHCLMAHTGMIRDGNIVRLSTNFIDNYDEYCERVDFRFVVKYVVPEIVNSLKEAHFLKMRDDYIDFLDSSFLFAYKDKLFSIHTDLSVMEIDDYCAIGSGSHEAIGSLLSTEGESPVKRIIKAIKASAASDIYVDYPIIITDTQKTSFEVITEKNEASYLNKDSKKKEGSDS